MLLLMLMPLAAVIAILLGRQQQRLTETLAESSAMRRAIHEDKDEMSIETQLFKQAYSLRENGLLKVISGITSLEEVMRVTAERGGDA